MQSSTTPSEPKKPNLINLNPSDSCGVGMVVSVTGSPRRRVLDLGLTSLANVAHRGAIAADGITGDGAGVMTTLPQTLVRRWMREMEIYRVPKQIGVGVVFLPNDPKLADQTQRMVCQQIKSMGLAVLGIRDVPIQPDQLGEVALRSCPIVRQIFISGSTEDPTEFERLLYLARRSCELIPQQPGWDALHIASMSCRTLSYKAMVMSASLSEFYPDLKDPDYECEVCVYHQRFSTNTQPTWSLCQPFRMLAHNGEINTVRGNRNWFSAREQNFFHEDWHRHRHLIQRLFRFDDSDSASLDNILELLTLSGRSLLHSISMMVPPNWKNHPDISEAEKAFYQFHSCFSEPWDGPAAIAATDGRFAVASVDKNGLRPARYKLTQDDLLVVGSEVGVERIDDDQVKSKGRLAAGEMIAVDLEQGKVLTNQEIRAQLTSQQDWQGWLSEHQTIFTPSQDIELHEFASKTSEWLTRQQIAAGFTREEIEIGIRTASEQGKEPTYSMGIDTPLAVLSRKPRHIADYFKQRFAQVTNPPIDPIREKNVMSLAAGLGPERNILDESPVHCRVIEIENPILLPNQLEDLLTQSPFKSHSLDCTWSKEDGPEGLKRALKSLSNQAQIAVEGHASTLVLSDRNTNADRIAIPILLAVGAVHHALIQSGQRMMCSLIADTSQVRDSHQLALLFGYGVTAVYPYLAYATIARLESKSTETDEQLNESTRFARYQKSLSDGLCKIMSKMGVSVLKSYQGAQLFEAIGVGPEVINTCFRYSLSTIGGVTFVDIARDCLTNHQAAFDCDASELKIADLGILKPRRHGEQHIIDGKVTKTFHQFVREGKAEDYLKYHQHVTPKSPAALRDLLQLTASPSGPISLDEVEPIESIRRRFTTAAMSLGAISPEAHEAIAIAMNEIGGKSNSGEGGEEPRRFSPLENGNDANSKIKQIASGRFGVNAEYLNHATELEIKMAQGAKPGEGGQLPGFKVNGLIARLRNTDPGVTLISPPPHHDIYSIEDLAQLIYDLKTVNPTARVCVKLVAVSGVGSIAVGAAKANADSILISGHEGGTGASPLTSIKHAGIPWELGLAETQQSLLSSNQRDRVVLRVDGGLRTGRDIVHAAILGAEEYNFGTMALIALGCVYVKKCHLNNCPVGIATQDPKYRERFKGNPENLIHYLNAVATECREIMASLGVRSIDELIGQTQYLTVIDDPTNPKTQNLSLACLLHQPSRTPRLETQQKYEREWNSIPAFDDRFLGKAQASIQDAKEGSQPLQYEFKVCNTDRNIGTRASGWAARKFGLNGLPHATIQLKLQGSAGQSLGAFLCTGLSIELEGEANDYVGKGMSGGEIVIRPPSTACYLDTDHVIAGNTLLYGATGGKFFAAGHVAERFAVRNSGATAVVEGCGEHGCEYMTRGTVILLGPVGNNFGAGMTGGRALVYDPENRLTRLLNDDTVSIFPLDETDTADLEVCVREFADRTQSRVAQSLLSTWDTSLQSFRKVTARQ